MCLAQGENGGELRVEGDERTAEECEGVGGIGVDPDAENTPRVLR